MQFSVVVSSFGRWNLLRECLRSISSQAWGFAHEALVVAPQFPSDSLMAEFSYVRFFREPQLQAPEQRNFALGQCHAPLVLFLDEDCQISANQFFDSLLLAHEQDAAVTIGGVYQCHPQSTFAGQIYNWMTQVWQQSGPRSLEARALPRLVGGCLSVKRKAFLKEPLFPQGASFGGEELLALKHLQERGLSASLQPALSVHHRAQHSWGDLFQRAWAHAQAKSISQSFAGHSRWPRKWPEAKGPVIFGGWLYLVIVNALSLFIRKTNPAQV